MTDVLNEALKEATLASLLGSTTVPTTSYDSQGHPVVGITTIQSAFSARIQARAHKGDFDNLIDQAVEKLTAEHLTELLGEKLVEQMLKGLETNTSSYNNPKPGWLALKAREIAVEAATAALSADESLLETLRQRIGMEVDRNRVGISVKLTDPED